MGHAHSCYTILITFQQIRCLHPSLLAWSSVNHTDNHQVCHQQRHSKSHHDYHLQTRSLHQWQTSHPFLPPDFHPPELPQVPHSCRKMTRFSLPFLIRSTSKFGLDNISGASSDPSSGSALSTVWFTLSVTITFSPPATSLVRVISAPSAATLHPSSLGSALEFLFSV